MESSSTSLEIAPKALDGRNRHICAFFTDMDEHYTARGSGLVGLTDRVEALGGSIRVSSRPGEGTHVTAELPLELEAGRSPEQPSAA
jgi:signal transduction histidine kinase